MIYFVIEDKQFRGNFMLNPQILYLQSDLWRINLSRYLHRVLVVFRDIFFVEKIL